MTPGNLGTMLRTATRWAPAADPNRRCADLSRRGGAGVDGAIFTQSIRHGAWGSPSPGCGRPVHSRTTSRDALHRADIAPFFILAATARAAGRLYAACDARHIPMAVRADSLMPRGTASLPSVKPLALSGTACPPRVGLPMKQLYASAAVDARRLLRPAPPRRRSRPPARRL